MKRASFQIIKKFREENGELLQNLCQCLYCEPDQSQQVYRALVLKLARKEKSQKEPYIEFRRAWILKNALLEITRHSPTGDHPVSILGTQTQWLKQDTDTDRLQTFRLFFHRLSFEQQIILVLYERLRIPLEEISIVVGKPVESVQFIRQQALEALRDWIWETATPSAPQKEPKNKQNDERVKVLCKKIEALEKQVITLPIRPQETIASNFPRKKSASQWRNAPWYVRSSVEGVGIAFSVLLVVGLIPRIKGIYEDTLEKRLQAYDMAELAPTQANPGLETNVAVADAVTPDALIAARTPSEENSSHSNSDSEELPPPAKNEKIKVGNSELWRFTIRTESLQEMKQQVVQALVQLSVPQNTPGLEGVKAPGGLQFDLLVPKEIVAKLKTNLQEISHPAADSTPEIANQQFFTWYKNVETDVPKGQTRVVIWLHQI